MRGEGSGAHAVDWCGMNHLHISASKTKEVVIDFRRNVPHTTPINIQGLHTEVEGEYKYLVFISTIN